MLSATRYLGISALVVLTYSASLRAQAESPSTGEAEEAAEGLAQAAPSTATVPAYDASVAVASAAPASPAADTKKTSSSRLIEEIVVTAQKREEQLQDVPISITAFSSEKLDALGVQNARDLEAVTPGLVYSTNPVNYSIIFIRGIGTDAFIPSVDASVATYVDGVYFPYNHGLASSFSEIERIEVLKGPQGTLFGRNTTGGALNIVTKKPDQTLHVKLGQSIESFGRTSSKGYVSGPLFGDVTGSLAVIYAKGDTVYKPTEASAVQRRPEKEDKGINLKLRWEITDELSAMVSGYITEGYTTLVNTAEAVKPAGVAIGVQPGEPYKYESNLDGFYDDKNQVAYTNIEWNPGNFTIKLFGSYQDVDGATLYDYDGSNSNGVYFDVPTEYVRGVTGEFQFLSTPGGMFTFNDALEWTTGYYYFKSSGGYNNVYFGVLEPDQPAVDYPVTLAGILGSALDIISMAGITLQNNVELELNGALETEAHAVYAQTTWRPLDWFGMTLGGRYQTEDRGTIKSSSGLSRTPEAPLPLFDFADQDKTTETFSPKIGFEFRPFDDDTMIYTSWQKGVKSGTYNVVAIYTRPNYVKPERVTAVELGIKGKLMDGSLVYSAAAFRNEVKNLQTLNISLVSGGAVQLANAPKATIDGFEFDLLWEVFPDVLPGFVLTANGTLLDGVYNKFPDASGFDPVTGVYFGRGQLVPSPPRDFSGNTTARTPRRAGTLGINQTLEVPGGSLELGVNGSYNSGYFYDTQNVTKQPQHSLLSARASYLYEPLGIRISALGMNLTGEKYFYDKLINDFVTNSVYAPKETYVITLGWDFKP